MTIPNGFLRSMSIRRYAALVLSTTILASGIILPAYAESAHASVDANGVDLVDGSYNLRLPVASIGSGNAELALIIKSQVYDNWSQIYISQTVYAGVTTLTVDLAQGFDRFTSADGYAVSKLGTGATLTVSGDTVIYTTLDGTSITFTNPSPNLSGGSSHFCDDNNVADCFWLPSTIDRHGGLTVSYEWEIVPNCTAPLSNPDLLNCNENWRLASVSNDAGYSINWDYVNPTGSPVPAWFQPKHAVFRNINVSMSAPPTVTYAYPTSGVMTVTTPGGRTWRVMQSGYGAVSGVRRPSASSDTTTISYTSGVVSAVTQDGITTNYSRSVAGSVATTTVTDAQSHTSTIVADTAKQRITSVTDALGHTTTYAYDAVGRPTEVVFPEGNKVQYSYDSRGNVTTTTLKAKPGSGLADIVTAASYPTTCTDAACNEPVWTKDAAGNQTDYTYDTSSGLLLSVTTPAPYSGANRPKSTFSYTAVAGVQMLTGVSQCQVGASCAGIADEVKTTVAYNANLLPTSVSKGAGDGSLTATSTASYDAVGNLVSADGPLSGTADTTTFRYGDDRELIGAISADPDGAGARKRQATKTTYNSDGQATIVEAGTVNGTSDTDWAAFVSVQQSTATYDANARKTKQVLTAGGSTYSVAQYSYDTVGRLECSALRMNPAVYGSLPTSACSLGTSGTSGSDRITRNTFNAAGQVTQVQTGYGTAEQATDAQSFTTNGQIASITDGENNTTSYEYDGFDRLVKTRYPVSTQGSLASSTTDYEQLSYNANSQVTSRRLRDGQTINYSYDLLGRLITKDLPSTEQDVTYSYDLLSRPTSIATSAQTLTLGYDALGRTLTQGGPLGTMTAQFDVAGRRTKLTWADGFYVSYDYDIVGNMTAVRENGASSGVGVLAQFSYDDLGRRTGLTRGNGTTTSYAFDAVSRLSSLAHDLTGSAQDVTTSFAYHPSGQIASSTRSNDGYAWPGATNVDRNYSVNGLNQLTASGAVSLGYDARGNLTSSGSDTYTYSSENLLTGGPGSVSLSYDPAMRLFQTSSTSATTRFGYDGQDLIAEYNTSGTLLRRYVHGPGSDEPLVWYEGSGTSDRRFIDADERGSVVATADSSGNALAIDSYDEYGIPASGNSGRFQYTGQTWLADLGLYYYKARIYSPTLGRFLQTDPIGYGDGANWYNYVGSDPVNGVDPGGLCESKTVKVIDEETGKIVDGYVVGDCGSGGSGGHGVGLGASGGQPHGVGTADNVYGDGGAGTGADIVVNGTRPKPKPKPKPPVAKRKPLYMQLPKLPYDRKPNPKNPVQTPNGCTNVPNTFPRSCNAHDVCYGSVGVPKDVCDNQFIENMQSEYSGDDYGDLPYVYYEGVRIFGQPFYDDAQRRSRAYPQ